MPFIARKDDRTVIPTDVDHGVTVTCTSCGGPMRVRGPFDDGRTRHFYHIDNVGDCTAAGSSGDPGLAESATHEKLKAFAVSGLRRRFDDDTYTRCGPEITVGVARTDTDVEQRRADALLEFHDMNRFFGEGVIVEVQHLNAGKDIRATTHDYLAQGYSVYWATVDDFTESEFLVEVMDAAFDERKDAAFTPYRDPPPPLDAPDRLITPDNNAPHTTTDPVPRCAHELVSGDESSRVCVRCGLQMNLCLYDEGRGFLRPLKRYDRRVSGEKVWAADQGSVEHPVEVRPVTEHGDSPDHTHQWWKPNDVFGGDKYRCSECESIMLVGADEIAIVHEEASDSWRPDDPS